MTTLSISSTTTTTTTTTDNNKNNLDHRHEHVWCFEPTDDFDYVVESPTSTATSSNDCGCGGGVFFGGGCCGGSGSSSCTSNEVLTRDGITQITTKWKYIPGTYTLLDNLLNPIWTWITYNLLPIWIAPNTVTAIGGCCCLISYLITARYYYELSSTTSSTTFGTTTAAFTLNDTDSNPSDYDNNDGKMTTTMNMINLPNWIYIMNGICLILYYTLDCCDGKQARRTKSSSPLGQLFDHGIDCVTNISHVSLIQCIVQFNVYHYMLLQVTLQFGFYQAQWEEYYTGLLPHSALNCIGTTEVLYTIGIWSILTGLNIYDTNIYNQTLSPSSSMIQSSSSSFVAQIIQNVIIPYMPFSSYILYGFNNNNNNNHDDLQVRHVIICIWVYGFVGLSILSFIRVVKSMNSIKIFLSAISKLISPLLLVVTSIYLVTTTSSTSTSSSTVDVVVLPPGGIRYPSLCVGLVFCIITIKLIVFGMAKMSYGSLQLDVIPLVIVTILYKTYYAKQQQDDNYYNYGLMIDHHSGGGSSSVSMSHFTHTKNEFLQLLFPFTTVAYLVRMIWWTRIAMNQLCQRLNIRPFTINNHNNNSNNTRLHTKTN